MRNESNSILADMLLLPFRYIKISLILISLMLLIGIIVSLGVFNKNALNAKIKVSNIRQQYDSGIGFDSGAGEVTLSSKDGIPGEGYGKVFMTTDTSSFKMYKVFPWTSEKTYTFYTPISGTNRGNFGDGYVYKKGE